MKVIIGSRVGVTLTLLLLTASAAYRDSDDPDVDLGSSGNCSNGNCDDTDDDDPKCPPDSSLDPTDGNCVCTSRRCFQPICRPPLQSVLRRRGNNVPGDCCDVYECVSPHDKNCEDVICPEEVEKCPEDSYRLPAYKSPEDCCLTPQSCQCLPRECEQQTCPAGQHPRVVRPGNGKPGTCCPLYDCVSDQRVNDSCLVNNSHHMANGTTWQKEPCTICSCLNGYLFCKASTSGNCTENPAGCMSSSKKLHQNGETWEEDPCTQCTCEAGEKKCIAYMCEVSCVNPVHVPGECCPLCNESSVVVLPPNCPYLNNCSLRCLHGFVRDEAGCYTCQCEAGPCLLECLHGFAHDARGHLLCECAEPEPTVALTTTSGCPSASECRKYCTLGPKYNKQGCEKCKCRSNNICKPLTDCKKLCTNGFAVNEKGCPVCRCLDDITTVSSDANHATSCFESDGSIHEDGETWHDGCRQCLCHEGVEMCNLVVCPRLNCVNPIFNLSTDCCAMCPDDLKTGNAPVKTLLCHSLDGTYKKEGEMWSMDPCTNCICHMGQILCDIRECPPTPCQKPIKDKDHCCPYCPYDSSFIEPEGKPCGFSHPHGSVWKQGNCESCKCQDGQAICYTQECDLENCPHPVLQKNQCCNICIDKMWQRSCRVGNATFEDSDRWMEDECTQCVCNDGHSMCTKQMCSPLNCDNAVRKPGRCCPTCPDRGDSSSFNAAPVKIFIYNIIITILSLVVLGLLICILILCKRSRRYCVSCPDSESLPSFKSLSKPKFKYNSSHSEYTTEKAKLASV